MIRAAPTMPRVSPTPVRDRPPVMDPNRIIRTINTITWDRIRLIANTLILFRKGFENFFWVGKGGSSGASVWVVGGCCIRGGFSCGGRLTALLLQCRAVGLRLEPTSCSKKATYQPAFWGLTSCPQRAAILPFFTTSSSWLLMKKNYYICNQQVLLTIQHQAHLNCITMSRGAFTSARDQRHLAQQTPHLQEHLIHLQEHLRDQWLHHLGPS